MKKIVFILFLLTILLVLISCGGETETTMPDVFNCEHDYRTIDKRPSTCMEGGYVTEECTKCGLKQHAELVLADHDYAEVELGISGIVREQCVYCNDVPTEKGALLLEILKPAKGDVYSSFNIYVQNSDPSGDYYTRYHMVHVYDDTRNNYAVNSASNINNYRIIRASVVKVTALEDTYVAWTELAKVLTSGEISFAIRQSNIHKDWLKEGAEAVLAGRGDLLNAGDFIGGYHGDEWLESVALFADGSEVALEGVAEGMVIPCSEIRFDQFTKLYAWGTSDALSHGVEVAEHTQSFTIDSNGIRNSQRVKWLRDDFEYKANECYLLMFPIIRKSGELTVSSCFESYDANGELLNIDEVPEGAVEKQTNINFDLSTRKLYMSSLDGFFGEVRFSLPDDTMRVKTVYSAIRPDSISDNKFYMGVESTENGGKTKMGEVFSIDVYYSIDYASPER